MKVSSSGLSSDLSDGFDTIVARATAPGRGALALVRLSGGELAAVVRAVCPEVDLTRTWQAQLVPVLGCGGEALERAVVTAYRGPRSYTGEDMLEVVVHGSPFLVQALVDGCVAAGAREAAPGEFTRRALANGKMDLIQAEAVADLVAAETAWQLRVARGQLSGDLSVRVGELRGRMVELLAAVEATLEFADHGVDEPRERLEALREGCLNEVDNLLSTAAAGERIRDGVRVVIVGAPNSGKSTLFNALLERERAIVSPRPGTTRDVVEGELELGGVRVVLVDTAGLCEETDDAIEAEGVRRARTAAAEAGVVMALWASDSPNQPEVAQGANVVLVRSKADLVGVEGGAAGGGWLSVSCVSGEGLEELRARLCERVAVDGIDELGGVAIARRHGVRLERAAHELRSCDLGQLELAAEGVRWALRELSEITGEVVDEEVLDAVFAQFCVGK